MKFFIDTANLGHIREAASLGILDGVTTNPTLLAREAEGEDFKRRLKEICDVVKGPVCAEVVAEDEKSILQEARTLAEIDRHMVIKIPSVKEGIRAISRLSREGTATAATLVFSPSQAILAARAGATYVIPFVGRLEDGGHYGMDLISQIVAIYENYEFDTEVIAASIRSPLHVVEAALAGVDIVTVPLKVIDQMIEHPMTAAGVRRFLEDWRTLGAEI
jgi:transaldolase